MMLDFIQSNAAASVAISILIGILIYRWLNQDPRRKDLPPGPTGLPFFGYYPYIPWNWTNFALQMKDKWGPIVYLNIAGVDTIFINDFDIVKDAFARDHFMDRPERTSFFTIFQNAGLVQWSGPLWKDQRRFSLKSLRDLGFGKKHGEEKILLELEHFVDYIEEHGKHGEEAVHLETPLGTSFSNVICMILGGERYHFKTPTRDKLNKIFLRSDQDNKYRNIFDTSSYWPLIAYLQSYLFPGSSAASLKRVRQVTTSHMNMVVDKIMNDKELESDSFVYTYMKHMESHPEEEYFTINNLKGCAMSFMLGGSFTTKDFMDWMLLIVALYPKMQNRMREEIDAAFGTSTPTTSDKLKCPFVECVINEVHRYSSIISLSLAHMVSKDDYLAGHFIPKGTEIIVNNYSIHYNESYFPDPKSFKPERFMSKEGKYVKSEYLIPFGYGKRACPGEVLAQMEIFCFTTRLIQKYNILLPEGVKVDLEDTVCNFFSRSPRIQTTVIFQKRV